jgi:uncharacterized protein (DUF1330 family)
MPAYVILRADMHDPGACRAYAERSPGVLARFGGPHIARGGRALTFEGAPETRCIVIAACPDFARAEACCRSADDQAPMPLRAGCASFEFILVDGALPA